MCDLVGRSHLLTGARIDSPQRVTNLKRGRIMLTMVAPCVWTLFAGDVFQPRVLGGSS